MIVRDIIASIIDFEAILTLYNNTFNPEITQQHLEKFISELLNLDIGYSEMKFAIVDLGDIGASAVIAGEGWDYDYDDEATYVYKTRWDVEYRAAKEVLSMEVINRSDLTENQIIIWVLEELGVYNSHPRY